MGSLCHSKVSARRKGAFLSSAVALSLFTTLFHLLSFFFLSFSFFLFLNYLLLPKPAIKPAAPDLVHYGMEVVLQCKTTGLVTPVYVVRKVDKNIVVDSSESVSQLQKVEKKADQKKKDFLSSPCSIFK